MKIAVQVYSVRDDAEKDFFGTLKKIKEMGYDGVEFAGLYGRSPEEIKDFCKELDLIPISAHVPYVDMLADCENVLSAYAKIGCKYVAIPYLLPEHRPGTPGFDDVVKNASVIGATAKKLGMQLLYHNHDFEFEKIGDKYALDVLYENVPTEYLQTELDTCWVNVGGENPADYVRKYTGRAPVVHLKDFVGSKSDNMYALIGIDSEEDKSAEKKFEFRSVGAGRQDFPSILAAAEDAGAGWVVVEQDMPAPGKLPIDEIKASREYLKSIGY